MKNVPMLFALTLLCACSVASAQQKRPAPSEADSSDTNPHLRNELTRSHSAVERAEYWCLADEYRSVAERASDPRVAAAARRAAEQYERAGPAPDEYDQVTDWRRGQRITVSLKGGRTCTTTVR